MRRLGATPAVADALPLCPGGHVREQRGGEGATAARRLRHGVRSDAAHAEDCGPGPERMSPGVFSHVLSFPCSVAYGWKLCSEKGRWLPEQGVKSYVGL